MDIETMGLGAGSYPEPPEEHVRNHKIEINLSFEFDEDFPEKWDKDTIVEDVRSNLGEYINLYEFENIDIDVY